MKDRTSARPRLVDPHGFAGPERAELAIAIAERDAVTRAQTGTIAAAERIDQAFSVARSAVVEAEEALAAAKAADVASQIDGTGGTASGVKTARLALHEAEDALDTAQSARDVLSTRMPAVEVDIGKAELRVEAAASAVLQAEAAGVAHALGAEMEGLQRQLSAASSLLQWFVKAGAIPLVTEYGSQFAKPLDPATRAAQARSYVPAIYWHDSNGQPFPAARCEAWDAALMALKADANAELPR
jgi:hypothetical protein